MSQPVSWCKVEALAVRTDLVSVVKDLSPPPITVMSISLKTIQNPKTHHNEIVSLAALVHCEFQMDKAPPQPPTVSGDRWHRADSARLLPRQDAQNRPRCPGGHDIFGFDLEVILQRINVCKVPHWSKIGRLRRSNMPKLG
ncbi:hypothetical protein KUCAC02_037221, partial [Chaenocephalus aceratus]